MNGKDTVADFIIEQLPDLHFQKKSFAYKLKKITSIISGRSMEDMLTQEGKKINIPEFNMTVGGMQQFIGTELFREWWDENIWIKALFADYGEKDNWIISDTRFKNEADYIKKMGGFLLRLEGDPGGVRARSNRDMNHASEVDLDDYDGFDLVWDTDRGREDLHELLEVLNAKLFN